MKVITPNNVRERVLAQKHGKEDVEKLCISPIEQANAAVVERIQCLWITTEDDHPDVLALMRKYRMEKSKELNKTDAIKQIVGKDFPEMDSSSTSKLIDAVLLTINILSSELWGTKPQ